jgi:hypothetical protein
MEGDANGAPHPDPQPIVTNSPGDMSADAALADAALAATGDGRERRRPVYSKREACSAQNGYLMVGRTRKNYIN